MLAASGPHVVWPCQLLRRSDIGDGRDGGASAAPGASCHRLEIAPTRQGARGGPWAQWRSRGHRCLACNRHARWRCRTCGGARAVDERAGCADVDSGAIRRTVGSRLVGHLIDRLDTGSSSGERDDGGARRGGLPRRGVAVRTISANHKTELVGPGPPSGFGLDRGIDEAGRHRLARRRRFTTRPA